MLGPVDRAAPDTLAPAATIIVAGQSRRDTQALSQN